MPANLQTMDFIALVLFILIVIAIIILVIILKGMALWKAARSNQKGWFVALLIINTLGILEIIYLAFFQKGAKPMAVTSKIQIPPKEPIPKPKKIKRKVKRKS